MATVHSAFPAANASSSGSSSTLTASLYVGDLHSSVTEGILYDVFAEFKSLTYVRLCKDASTGRSLCYGYANFLSCQDGTFSSLFDIQKRMLGEVLYPLVEELEPQLAAKITGMLAELDDTELFLLLQSPEDLAVKVNEAFEFLKSSKTNLTVQTVFVLITWHLAFRLSEGKMEN